MACGRDEVAKAVSFTAFLFGMSLIMIAFSPMCLANKAPVHQITIGDVNVNLEKVTFRPPVWTKDEIGNVNWKSCAQIPVLNETCIGIEFFPTNLTLIVFLSINNNVVLQEEVTATQICVDQYTLIQLLELIPALTPFKPLIDLLIKTLHLIPGDVFSVCVIIENLNVTTTGASGCVFLNTTLMCWKGSCLYKGTESFGCFNIPVNGAVVPFLDTTPATPSDHSADESSISEQINMLASKFMKTAINFHKELGVELPQRN